MMNTTNDKKEKCYLCLSDDFKEEIGRFYVEIEGGIRLVHRKCWSLHKEGRVNTRLVIK